jgi:glycosyltransferase involved in cell wall biosynthesis
MKTVLIITDNLPDQINGVVTTYKNIETIARNDGYHFVYIDPREFRHVGLFVYPEVKLAWVRKIGKKIRKIQPNHIHIATEGPIGLAAKVWCDRKKFSYTTSYHTRFPEAIKKLLGIPEFITWSYIRWFHKKSSTVFTTTETMVGELKEHKFHSEVIPWSSGVDREIFNTDAATEDLTGCYPVLLCVSRISKEKNLEDFCSLEYPGATKILVGDGPHRKELEKNYPDVVFTGFKTGKELAKYYANADVFVFPSRWETFGIVMIEAMACGTPVAAYPEDGPLDVIEEGKTGYTDKDLRTAIHRCLGINRNKVLKHSAKWSWENCWNIFKERLVKV